MACFHPKKGFQIGLTESGSPKYKIMPWEVNFVYEAKDGLWKGSTGSLSGDRDYCGDEFRHHIVESYIPIPCGNCIGCRLDYARDWSARLMHELQMHDPNTCWFLTLTYNDDALMETFVDPTVDRLRLGADHLGEAAFFTNLDPRDMTLFWKRLRKDFPDRKLVYYQAGEYGEKRQRCHYHAIVYDLPLDQAELAKNVNGVNELGNVTWRSPYLESKWKLGNVIVGKVTTESCSYVARYTLKKAREMWEYDFTNRTRPFVRMSRHPGIGKTYLDSHPELFEVSRFPLPSRRDKPLMVPHPRYYLKYLKEMDEDRYNEIKFDRAVAGVNAYEKALTNEKPYLDQLRDQELDILRKTSILRSRKDL